ncbi:MAG: sigma factor-like helix-turn-helix DNA-binding protein [Polyangiales bacterium]
MKLALCVAGLTERARQVLLLTYADDLDATAIAGATGTTPVAVRVTRKRALEALRRCIEGGPGDRRDV